MKLKPTTTVDKSGPPVSGKVVGDSAPPAHINVVPVPASAFALSEDVNEHYARGSGGSGHVPEVMGEPVHPKMDHRQSVDWFASRAVDVGGAGSAVSLPVTTEEEEEEDYGVAQPAAAAIPAIQVDEAPATGVVDLMGDIEKSIGE
jgi:hypothetical protein